jgi:tRNA(Leu) C34 or U34 (ribose-2'-O)-methylase TrmL
MRGYADVMLANCDRPLDHFPDKTPFVGVEFVDNAEDLPTFEHPEKAVYIFGPEDGSLPVQARKHCWRFVCIPTKHCLNLSTAVATVLYDRAFKVKGVDKHAGS